MGFTDKLPEPGKRGIPAIADVFENLVHRAVEAIRGFGLADPRSPGQPFCDIRLLHSDFNVAGGAFDPARLPLRPCLQSIENAGSAGSEEYNEVL